MHGLEADQGVYLLLAVTEVAQQALATEAVDRWPSGPCQSGAAVTVQLADNLFCS